MKVVLTLLICLLLSGCFLVKVEVRDCGDTKITFGDIADPDTTTITPETNL